MTNLQQARANARLDNGRIQDSDGHVLTLRQWVESKVRSGFVPTIKQVADTAKITKLESELAMLRRSWEPSGNPNCPATKRFYAVKQELADGPTKADYRLVKGDAVFTCTKTEYDYALTLPMGINFN